MSGSKAPRFGAFSNWIPGRQALASTEHAEGVGRLPETLLELARLHCSVINHCGFCTAMHRAKALQCGVTEKDVDAVVSGKWREHFSGRSAAVLELADAMTKLDKPERLEKSVVAAKSQFDAEELSILCFQIGVINAWNRIAMADGLEAEHYQSR